MPSLVENLSCVTTHATRFEVALDKTSKIATRDV